MIECDYCKQPAVRNYQKIWVSWKINQKDESYSKEPELELDIEESQDEENIHLCKEHLELWLKNEL